MSQTINGFFAYPSKPHSIPEIINSAIKEINKSQECQIKTWQECSISGKIIIDVICREIDRSDLFIADLTGANPNVLFELGYAIGKQKRVWLILDTSIEESKTLYDQLKILTTVGYSPYSNSQNIIDEFFKEHPWTDLDDTIFKNSIEPSLDTQDNEKLLYLKNQHETEASTQLDRIVQSFLIPFTISDPRESSVNTLVWYGTKIWSSPGVIAHFSGESRRGYRLHNSRYAFVSGLAHGLEKPLLMLAEEDYPIPIDYKDILFHYKTPSDCAKYAQEWLESISANYARKQKSKQEYAKKISLVTDLRNLSLGEYQAENEEDTLENYFVETPYFHRLFNGEPSIVVGNKGSGKTANFLMVANRLKEDKRNLVCVIKPLSYDVQGVVRLSKLFEERDKKGYVSEVLWKYLIYSEIAITAYDEIKQLPYVNPDSPEDRLMKLMESSDGALKDDFAVRLERCVETVLSSKTKESLHGFRESISENLHENTLRDLRELLGELLSNRQRVIVLIDNLDKAWDRSEDIDHLSVFLFGLMGVSNSIPKEFARKDHWRKPVNISITLFIRNDIFSRIMKHASEPDSK
jgi:predicted AAA+ superfamily ATPase